MNARSGVARCSARTGALVAISLMACSHASLALDIGLRHTGISFGNSTVWHGLRFNLRDEGVRRIDGFSLSLLPPGIDEDACMQGVLCGLSGIRATQVRGVGLSLWRHDLVAAHGVFMAGFVLRASSPTENAQPRRTPGLQGVGMALVGIHAARLQGIGLGGLGLSAGRVQGLCLSGLLQMSESCSGLAASGLITSTDRAQGILLGGAGVASNEVQGMTLAGIGASLLTHQGLALAGIFIGGSRLSGIHVSAGWIRAFHIQGFTLAGLHVGGTRLSGLALSPFVGAAESFQGLSLGLSNRGTRVRGVQIGLVNQAHDLRGIQIGAANFAGNGRFPFFPLLNARF